MDRRDFIRTAGVVSAWPTTTREQPAASPSSTERDVWVGVLRKLGDPVLNNLANGTLKARMPVEQAASTDRRSVTHLEALGRLIASIAPWIELREDPRYADLAARAIARAVDPASPDFMNVPRERQ